jgi:hypothetical protein
MYRSPRPAHTWIVQLLACIARCTPLSSAFLVKCSALKSWSHNFQWGLTPKYPSQTAAKMAAYEIELGAR